MVLTYESLGLRTFREGGAGRAFGALRDRIPGASASTGQGVSVEVGEKQAAVDLQILVEYGVAIADLARSVRRNVVTSIEQMTGLQVVEVNITVSDVHLPGDEEPRRATGCADLTGRTVEGMDEPSKPGEPPERPGHQPPWKKPPEQYPHEEPTKYPAKRPPEFPPGVTPPSPPG